MFIISNNRDNNNREWNLKQGECVKYYVLVGQWSNSEKSLY